MTLAAVLDVVRVMALEVLGQFRLWERGYRGRGAIPHRWVMYLVDSLRRGMRLPGRGAAVGLPGLEWV